jgi:hypothetical protein
MNSATTSRRWWSSSPTPEGPDPDVVRALDRACRGLNADECERRALFRAAILASGLRRQPRDPACGRAGPFAQDESWGKAVARRDPYVSASVFLEEARRLRPGPGETARLAARVQGRGRPGDTCSRPATRAASSARSTPLRLPDHRRPEPTRARRVGHRGLPPLSIHPQEGDSFMPPVAVTVAGALLSGTLALPNPPAAAAPSPPGGRPEPAVSCPQLPKPPKDVPTVRAARTSCRRQTHPATEVRARVLPAPSSAR